MARYPRKWPKSPLFYFTHCWGPGNRKQSLNVVVVKCYVLTKDPTCDCHRLGAVEVQVSWFFGSPGRLHCSFLAPSQFPSSNSLIGLIGAPFKGDPCNPQDPSRLLNRGLPSTLRQPTVAWILNLRFMQLPA